jgi:hypothetical protein
VPAVNPLPTSGTIEYTTIIEDIPFLGLPWKNSQQKDSAAFLRLCFHGVTTSMWILCLNVFVQFLFATRKLLGITSIPTENIHSFSLKGNVSRD